MEAVAELKTWQPPRYRWKAHEVFGAHLTETLNSVDQSGWEVFQILPSVQRCRYVIFARQPIEEE